MRRSRFLSSLLLNATFQWTVTSGAERRKMECLAEAQFSTIVQNVNDVSTQRGSSLSQEVMRLRRILSSASYGGTFFQKKANQKRASRDFIKCREATPLIAERSDSDALQRYCYARTSQSAQRSAPRSAAPVNGGLL